MAAARAAQAALEAAGASARTQDAEVMTMPSEEQARVGRAMRSLTRDLRKARADGHDFDTLVQRAAAGGALDSLLALDGGTSDGAGSPLSSSPQVSDINWRERLRQSERARAGRQLLTSQLSAKASVVGLSGMSVGELHQLAAGLLQRAAGHSAGRPALRDTLEVAGGS